MPVVRATAAAKPGVWLGSGKRVDLAYKCRCSPVRRCAPGCPCLTKTDPATAAIYCCARPAPPPAAHSPDPLHEPAAVATPPADEDRGPVTPKTKQPRQTPPPGPVVTRWTVTRAVRGSDLPPPSRHIMLTLADVANTGTSVIPARFTPSLVDIARETGLHKVTVINHLDDLESWGWVVRTKPDKAAQVRGERTRYRLTVPADVILPSPVDTSDIDDIEVGAEDDQDDDMVADDNQPGSPELPGVVIDNNQAGSSGQPPLRKRSDLSRSGSDLEDLPPDAALRPDVEALCIQLADRIEANGSQRPRITKKWRDAARLMLDRDGPGGKGRKPEDVAKAIDWCQADDFWQAHILTMQKLREKYEQLRLVAQRQARASPNNTLVERNGLKVRPDMAERLDDRSRWAAMDAARANPQSAVGGAE